jgi:hypothetical protein
MGPEDTIRRFCEAINEHDGDGAAALADPGIVIVIGPNELDGVEALRAMAAQRPEGLDSSVDVLGIEGADGRYAVTARRVQRWAETGELALDQALRIEIELNDHGLVSRAEMHPKSD